MRRVVLFGALLSIGLLGILIWLSLMGPWWAGPTPDMSEMMRRMMGWSPGTTPSLAAPLHMLIPLGFLLLAVVGAAGLAYYLAMPEIPRVQPEDNPAAPRDAYQMVLRTLTQDERRLVEVLLSHNGVYLQKYLAKEAGLSRLRTHRIVKRLAERGLLRVSPKGNTNEVALSEWFRPPSARGGRDRP